MSRGNRKNLRETPDMIFLIPEKKERKEHIAVQTADLAADLALLSWFFSGLG